MQRLAAAKDCGEGLNGYANDVVLWLLCGEGGAGGLRVETEHLGARILRAKAIAHDAGPQPPGGAELGDLLQQVRVRVEEE